MTFYNKQGLETSNIWTAMTTHLVVGEKIERAFLFQVLNLHRMERHGQGGIPRLGLTFGRLLALPQNRMSGTDASMFLKSLSGSHGVSHDSGNVN